ncbi:MAG: tRNA pseudouridine(55) synthase TruB [Burkholderiales bacterium]
MPDVEPNSLHPVLERKPFEKLKIDGFLLYDKPKGIGSNRALQGVRRLFKAERAGHTGTLDPLASGLLIICFGQATRFAGELLGEQKTYWAEVRLGERTSTADAEGEIVESRPVDVKTKDVEAVLKTFCGDILQVPPMHSALKRDGVPLYRLARKGLEVVRQPRSVTIYSIELIASALPLIQIRVRCSKGTYIRVLAEDIGASLGCGAYLANLRRVEIGPFKIEEAVSDEVLASQVEHSKTILVRPSDQLAYAYPEVCIDAPNAESFCHGRSVATTLCKEGEYRVYGEDRHFLGTGQANSLGLLQPKRVMAQAANLTDEIASPAKTISL